MYALQSVAAIDARRCMLIALPFLFSLLQACSSTPGASPVASKSKVVCDSYIIMDMCVEDLVGDGTVDMVYFSDTDEIFMYQQGRQDQVAVVMPLHR